MPILSHSVMPDPVSDMALDVMNAKQSVNVPSRIWGMNRTRNVRMAAMPAFRTFSHPSLLSADLLITYPTRTKARIPGRA